jgi:hypothetical protein
MYAFLSQISLTLARWQRVARGDICKEEMSVSPYPGSADIEHGSSFEN